MAGSRGDEGGEALKALNHRLDQFAQYMEKMKLAEYVDLLHDTKRLLWVNFIAGLARGVGMAIGFSLLGAVIIYVLTRTFWWNLPVIGGFIAQIVRIVQTQLAR
ncbi:MAG: hypothetical protein HPY55_13565 [Firmicutes bacterium]|nr:hypothetical protein [Bacillota bacterium]